MVIGGVLPIKTFSLPKGNYVCTISKFFFIRTLGSTKLGEKVLISFCPFAALLALKISGQVIK